MHKGKQVGLQVCVWSSPCPEGGYLSQLQCSIFLRCCHLWWIEKCTLLCIYVTTVGMCRTNAVRKQSGYNLYMGWYLFWSVDEMVESTPYTCNWLKFSVVVACLFWLRRLYGAFLFCRAFKPFIIAAQCQMPTCLTSELPGHLPAKVSRCCSNDRLYF